MFTASQIKCRLSALKLQGTSRQPHDTQISEEGSRRITSLRTFLDAGTSVVAYLLLVSHLLLSSSPPVGRNIASRFLLVNLNVLSQGNLRGRSLKDSRSATTSWLTYTTLSSGGFLYLLVEVHSLIMAVRIYNTSSGVSTALWLTVNWPYKTTNVMHWKLFIRQILLLSSTCFEYQVLIFRRTKSYINSIWYRHSL